MPIKTYIVTIEQPHACDDELAASYIFEAIDGWKRHSGTCPELECVTVRNNDVRVVRDEETGDEPEPSTKC